jgi:hypothetical protein
VSLRRHIGGQIVGIGMQGNFCATAVFQHELRSAAIVLAISTLPDCVATVIRSVQRPLMRNSSGTAGRTSWAVNWCRRAYLSASLRSQSEARCLLELKPSWERRKRRVHCAISHPRRRIQRRLQALHFRPPRRRLNATDQPDRRMVGQWLDTRSGFDATGNPGLYKGYDGLVNWNS